MLLYVRPEVIFFLEHIVFHDHGHVGVGCCKISAQSEWDRNRSNMQLGLVGCAC